MRKRLVLVVMSILLLPVWVSISDGSKSAVPFASVAYAGHTIGGHWCECGTPGCICEPDEIIAETPGKTSKKAKARSHQGTASADRGRADEFDLGSSALLAVLLFMLWARMRF
ncbi:MAG: hypothetical protein L0229_02900 [Blastocatellia bacterium]|nr:hypothetical protein [Blastocatellia bacterium]